MVASASLISGLSAALTQRALVGNKSVRSPIFLSAELAVYGIVVLVINLFLNNELQSTSGSLLANWSLSTLIPVITNVSTSIFSVYRDECVRLVLGSGRNCCRAGDEVRRRSCEGLRSYCRYRYHWRCPVFSGWKAFGLKRLVSFTRLINNCILLILSLQSGLRSSWSLSLSIFTPNSLCLNLLQSQPPLTSRRRKTRSRSKVKKR